MNERDKFLRACKLCQDEAIESGRLRIVRRSGDDFVVSSDVVSDGWLFKCYPGGRKLLSFAGAAIAKVE